MKKFIFQSFDTNALEEKSLLTYQDFLDTKILNVFFLDDLKTLAILSINESIIEESLQPPPDDISIGNDEAPDLEHANDY